MKIFVVILSMFFFSGTLFAVDDGGRCRYCGKLTLLGSRHICTPKNKEKPKNSLGKNKSKKEDAQENVLPKFGDSYSYYVQGVVIYPKGKTLQLVCTRSVASSMDDFYFFEINEYSSARKYYEKHCAHIPVLGVRGFDHSQQIQDETLRVAIEQLKLKKQNAMTEYRAEIIQEKKCFIEFNTPHKCLAKSDTRIDDSFLNRKWTNTKGLILEGVWIANYKAYNVDGIVILSKKNKKLYRVPISTLSNKDVEFIKTTKIEAVESNVDRFKLVDLTIKKESDLAERFGRLGVKEMNFEAVVFARGINESKDKVLYVQLFPDGQICEVSEDSISRVNNKVVYGYGSTFEKVCRLSLSSREAEKGPVNALEKMLVAVEECKKKKVAERLADEAEMKASEIQRLAEEKEMMIRDAEERVVKEKERPIRDEYNRLSECLKVALGMMERYYPEKHCEIHKWKEIYAPKFEKSAYGLNYMKAIELMGKGLIKCSCSSEFWNLKYDEAVKEVKRIEKQIDELKAKNPGIEF